MQKKYVTYEDQGTVLEGFMATNAPNENLPGVILCHAWSGRDEFVCEKAIEIANWGYATFALDVYGKGVHGKNKEENTKLMMPFIKDRLMLQKRLLAALKTFQAQPSVDKKKISVMGFCFGGLCALDIARSGADVKCAVSIHGNLSHPEGVKTQSLKAKILALHGYEDPLTPLEQVSEFEKEMTQAKADWQVHIFGNTKHGFTDPKNNDQNMGIVYNPISEKRSWMLIQAFLNECLEAVKK
jgi:dienelactone hydrolase